MIVRIVDGAVREIIPTAATVPNVTHWYGADFAAECVNAPEDVRQGWIYDGTTFSPPSASQPSVEDLRAAKIAELSTACEQTIFAGIDATTPSFGTLHYPLTDRDQSDLAFFKLLIAAGGTGWLYNAQGQDHEFYTATDLALIANAGLEYVTYNRTYFSELRKWVNRETDLSGIAFGAVLPDDLASDFNAKLAMIGG
jgi:hypothetical protein